MEIFVKMLIDICLSSIISKVMSLLIISLLGFFGYAYFFNPEILKTAGEMFKQYLPSLIQKAV